MILLGIGSNLSSSYGNRFDNIDLAISFLEGYDINIVKKSSYYETLSFPDEKNPKFINVVIEVSTHLNPIDLASVLIFIEEKLERKRGKKNSPRTCDIDIIDFNSEIKEFKYQNLTFTVPHKELSFRNFVLFPLMEIVPDWFHPVTNDSIKTLANKLPEEYKKSILKVEKS